MNPKIKPSIWSDDDFWPLSDAAKVAFFWLLTNGDTSNCGLIQLSLRKFSTETGKTAADLDGVCMALGRGIVRDGNFIWLRNFMRHQWTPGERSHESKFYKHLCNSIASMPATLRDAALVEYPEFIPGVHRLLNPPSPASSPLHTHSDAPSPSKGDVSPQSRAEQSRAEQSRVERGVGETKPSPDAHWPDDAEVIAFALQWPGELATGTPPMTEAFTHGWIAKMTGRTVGWPANWQRAMVAEWRSTYRQAKHPGENKKNGASADVATIERRQKIKAIEEELESVRHFLYPYRSQGAQAPAREERRERELSATLAKLQEVAA